MARKTAKTEIEKARKRSESTRYFVYDFKILAVIYSYQLPNYGAPNVTILYNYIYTATKNIYIRQPKIYTATKNIFTATKNIFTATKIYVRQPKIYIRQPKIYVRQPKYV